MFLTFTPNPCIERTFQVPILADSQRIDSQKVLVSAGGKGLNAARVAAHFGSPVTAIGPVGRRQSLWLREMGRADGIECDWVEVEADTRFCLNILHGDGKKTEIVENGAALPRAAGTQLLDKWRHWLPHARLALIGGSYPPSPDASWQEHATHLCDLAAQAGVPVIYDGVDAPFLRALSSKTPPWAIKPNLQEAARILGRALETRADERRAVRDLGKKGVEIVLLSCGARGLYLGYGGDIEWLEAPRIHTVSAVGAGDALVGAFAAKWLENGDIFRGRALGRRGGQRERRATPTGIRFAR